MTHKRFDSPTVALIDILHSEGVMINWPLSRYPPGVGSIKGKYL